jgi:hypothetical protein
MEWMEEESNVNVEVLEKEEQERHTRQTCVNDEE